MAEHKTIDVERPIPSLDLVYLGMYSTRGRGRQQNRFMQKSELFRRTLTTEVTSVMSRPLQGMKRAGKITAWIYDMQSRAGTCWETYVEVTGKNAHKLRLVEHIDDHHLSRENIETRRELHETCARTVLTCLYHARIGRPDLLSPVNSLTRSVADGNRELATI